MGNKNSFCDIKTKILYMPFNNEIVTFPISYILYKINECRFADIINDKANNEFLYISFCPICSASRNNDKSLIKKNSALLKKFNKIYKKENIDYIDIAKFFRKLIKRRINNYYIIIHNTEKIFNNNLLNLDIRTFMYDEYIRNTFLYFCLFKLAKLALLYIISGLLYIISGFTFKIYSMSDNKYRNLLKNNMNDIKEYNHIELGTEQQIIEYNNIITDIYNKFPNRIYFNNYYLIFYIIFKIFLLNLETLKDNNNNNTVWFVQQMAQIINYKQNN